ncbi:MAG: hypothetical protein PHH85_01985 [Candidatus Methanoperedens sp.]|nr:hypothetical protein [Candidatus Methanoperedens sp.]
MKLPRSVFDMLLVVLLFIMGTSPFIMTVYYKKDPHMVVLNTIIGLILAVLYWILAYYYLFAFSSKKPAWLSRIIKE